MDSTVKIQGKIYTFKKPTLQVIAEVENCSIETPDAVLGQAYLPGGYQSEKFRVKWDHYLDAILEGKERPKLEEMTYPELVSLLKKFDSLAYPKKSVRDDIILSNDDDELYYTPNQRSSN